MKKTTCKRIIGLFILTFAFFVVGIPNVLAEDITCAQYIESHSYIKSRYIPTIEYNYTTQTMTTYINPSNLDGVNVKLSDVKFKLTEIIGVGSNGQRTGLALADKLINGNQTLTATSKDSEKLKIKVAANLFNTYDSIELKFVPDGYIDPDYKDSPCCAGKKVGETCGITDVSASYSIDYTGTGEKMEKLTLEIEPGNPGGTSGLDCTNYDTKFTAGSFEYEFCKAKTLAPSENRYDFTDTTGTKKKGFLTFAEKTNGKTRVFKCDKNQFVPNDVENNPNYYTEKNRKYLYGSSDVNISTGLYYYYNYPWAKEEKKSEELTCKLKCEESVVVEYGPPIASKAGLCFGYKVRVTSRVVCNQAEAVKPPVTEYKVCTPYPYCETKKGSVGEQGGPNDSFDDCVQSCDNGKYTDKCVNKCYNIIYGKAETTKMVAKQTLEDVSAQMKKVENTTCEYDGKGYYIDGSTIKWDLGSVSKFHNNSRKYCFKGNASNNDSVKLPICYSDYKTEETFPFDPTYFQDTKNNTGKCERVDEDGVTRARYYDVYNEIGIPIRTSGKNGCEDTCKWKGCKYDDVYLNRKDAEADMKKNEDAYNDAKAQCSAKSTCSTTESQYVISVNYTTYSGGKESEQTIYFPYVKGNNNNNSKETKNIIGYNKDKGYATCARSLDNTVILNQSGSCYKCENDCDKDKCKEQCDADGDNCGKYCARDCDKHWYQTEWTFVGTWFDEKHREVITYDKDSITNTDIYTFKKQEFCLPQMLKSVNSEWYYLYQLHIIKLDQYKGISINDGVKTCETDKVERANPNPSVEYNIKASTRKFGLFEWDIDMECFYATPSANYEESSKVDKDCETGNSKEKYRIRTVDLKNLFPDADGKGTNIESGTQTSTYLHFNWSKYANQTIKDPKYTSTPYVYKNYVESLNYGVYDGEKYLDYEIYLTKDIINQIKNDDVDYGTWDGTVVNRGTNRSRGIYKSDFIRTNFCPADGAVNGKNKCPRVAVLGCNNIENYNATECQTEFKEGN